LVGPSGSGKTSLANIMSSKGFYKPITCTTRNKRLNERNEIDYFFISKNQFQNKINKGLMADYDEIFDTFYGVEKSQFFQNNLNVIMPATFKGVSNLRQHFDNVISIFLDPPPESELRKRMSERQMKQELIEDRIQSIKLELQNACNCDYVVSTNQRIEQSCKDLERIIIS